MWEGIRTHSVSAFGKNAHEIIAEHILDKTPIGKNSPLMKLPNYNGKILFIGDILNTCTFMHGVEEVVGSPYCLKKTHTSYIIDDGNGRIIEKDMIDHDFYGWGGGISVYQKYIKISRH